MVFMPCKFISLSFRLTQGEVVALDRIRNKIDRIRQNAKMLHLHSIKAYSFNSTQAVSSDPAHETEGTDWQQSDNTYRFLLLIFINK